MTFHLPDIDSLSDEILHALLDKAHYFSDESKVQQRTLQNRIIFNIFMEDSTRTRMSFEVAAKRLGADVVNFNVKSSSVNKNESTHDTFLTLNAYAPDSVILRSADYNAPRFAMSVFDCPVINAGDSFRAHPTQGLLDAMTLQQALGRDLSGKIVAICGDIAHSRVARSAHAILTRLGVSVRLIAPELLMPKLKDFEGAERHTDMDVGLKQADAVMMLRIQKERMAEGYSGKDHDFFIDYGLTRERLDKHAKNAFVLHPGPMNRGVEIADDVADDPRRSLILRQVTNGIPTRMAVLDYAINGS